MIRNQDRSYYIGASDTDRVVCSWETKTFEEWWLVKLGITTNDFQNYIMKTGNGVEHKIIKSLGIPVEYDKQLVIGRLRINLDANSNDTIYECKTYKNENGFKVPLKYKRQVWVQMYGTNMRKAFIVAYGLKKEDYKNWFLPVDKERLNLYPIEYNEQFIREEYIPRLKYLEECLIAGRWPKEREVA